MMKGKLMGLAALLCAAALLLCGCGSGDAPVAATSLPGSTPPAPSTTVLQGLRLGVVLADDPQQSLTAAAQATALEQVRFEQMLGDKQLVLKTGTGADEAAGRAAMQACLDAGCTVVFATEPGHAAATAALAGQHPNTLFYQWGGPAATADNLAVWQPQLWQAQYLAGLVAGAHTAAGQVGFVQGAGPQQGGGYGQANAFALGVARANPAATVVLAATGTAQSDALEAEAALALINAGCDVLAQSTPTAQPQQVAAAHGVPGIGYGVNMHPHGQTVLASAMVHWDRVFAAVVDAWQNEAFVPGAVPVDIGTGMLGLSPLAADTPPELDSLVADATLRLASGALNPFTGPLAGTDGEEALPAGSMLSPQEVDGMDWLVAGITLLPQEDWDTQPPAAEADSETDTSTSEADSQADPPATAAPDAASAEPAAA